MTKSSISHELEMVGAAEYIPSSRLKDVVFTLAILLATKDNSRRNAV